MVQKPGRIIKIHRIKWCEALTSCALWCTQPSTALSWDIPAQAAWAQSGDEELSDGPRVRTLLQNVRPDFFETAEGMKDREPWRNYSRLEETEKTWERNATCGSPDQQHLGTCWECSLPPALTLQTYGIRSCILAKSQWCPCTFKQI